MKTRLYIICVFLIAVLMGACFSPHTGEENFIIPAGKGKLSIVWGNSTAMQYAQQSELPNFLYNITLTGPGGKQEHTFFSVPSATFTVVPGTWTVTIKGYDPKVTANGRTLKVMGVEQVQVTAGTNGAKIIPMYTAKPP